MWRKQAHSADERKELTRLSQLRRDENACDARHTRRMSKQMYMKRRRMRGCMKK